jgi:hypothetical protein
MASEIIEIEFITTPIRHLYKLEDSYYKLLKLDCNILYEMTNRYVIYIEKDDCNIYKFSRELGLVIRTKEVYCPSFESEAWRFANQIKDYIAPR